MGTIATAVTSWLTGERRFTLRRPPQWFIDYFGGGPSSSGLRIGHQQALQYSPFWAAVRIISGTLAALPCKVYERLKDGGKQPLAGHRVYSLVHERPNPYMDWVTFAETRMAHVLCYGNGYAEIQRDGAGRPVALWPLLPNRTSRKIKDGGVLYYEVRLGDSGETVEIADENVLHIKGLGFDGYTGYDVVRYHKEALGYGVAVKQYGARFYANDANPGGILECPSAMSDRAYARLKESWRQEHTGLSHAHRMQILEEGAKWTKIGVEPEKAQAIEAQKLTVDDCARIFQIPPHKLMSMEFSKYANVYELNNDFYCSAMLYWFRKWEQEINYKLLMPSERGRLFVAIVVDALLRGNAEARAKLYAAGRQWGWYSVNDIHQMENMNPIGPAGDIYLEPLNMKPAGSEAESLDESVRDAHRRLLAGQWLRVIRKQINALQKGPRDDFWSNHRMYAWTVLSDAATAYASLRGIDERASAAILHAVIGRHLKPNVTLTIQDATRLAEAVMEEVGGNHAIRK